MTTTRPIWKRAVSGQRWTAEGHVYEVCMNDTGRTFRVMLRKADGHLVDLPSDRRYRSLEAAINVAEAYNAKSARTQGT